MRLILRSPLRCQMGRREGMCLLPWLISSLTLICGECRRWGKEREAVQEREREERYGGSLGKGRSRQSEWPVNSSGHLIASLMDRDWLINPSSSGWLYCKLPCHIFNTHTTHTPTYMQTNMPINKPMKWARMHIYSISSLDTHSQWIITLSMFSVKPEP